MDVVNGPNAVRRGVQGIFVAGNHDWGQAAGAGGAKRLQNQEDLLTRMRERGTPVWLLPKAGTPGPHVFDVGQHLRILLLDTAWWLLTAEVLTLAVFAVVAIVKVYANHPGGSINPNVGWLNPFEISSFNALIDGVLLGIFIYWGWDSGVAVTIIASLLKSVKS